MKLSCWMDDGIVGMMLLLSAATMAGCQQVVSIDLNKANPHIVIEGNVTDQQGPYVVKISKTGNYFEPTLSFPAVTGAAVVVTDDGGQADTLRETEAGTYESTTLRGIAGRTYALTVVAEGETYQASSSMPAKVFIDTLYSVYRPSGRGGSGYDIYITFRDPPEPGNYYRLNATSSRPIPSDSIDGERYRLYTDKLTNGNEMQERIRAGDNVLAGDTITVDLLAIDQASYDYFNTLRDILQSDQAATSLAPANPNSNISNGSLGYFAAYTVDTRKIVIR